MSVRFIFIGIFIGILLCYSLNSAYARSSVVIRDSEIEAVIATIVNPIFINAGYDPSRITIHIVQDASINAFVMQGMQIFIHTGLLLHSKDPAVITGVMAHETGHIIQGHLARKREAMKSASQTTILGYILGIAATVAGMPDAGQALVAGGSHVGTRNFLKYNRTQEESADIIAADLLQKSGYSINGLVELLNHLVELEKTQVSDPNPYILSHPLSTDRIALLRNHESVAVETNNINELKQRYERAYVKLKAFLEPPKDVLQWSDTIDNPLLQSLAKAIAYFKQGKIDLALTQLDPLILEHPQDQYLVELKGQILFEGGRIDQSTTWYRKAYLLSSNNELIKMQYAITLIATDEMNKIENAITLLQQIVHEYPNNTSGWHQLAIAYGKKGDKGRSFLALAKEAETQGKRERMKELAKQAKQHLLKGTPAYLQAEDLLEISNRPNK